MERIDIGYENKAVIIKKGEKATYAFALKNDIINIEVALLPEHAVLSDDLRFSIGFDNGEKETVSIKTAGRSEEWKENVLNNRTVRKFSFEPSNEKEIHFITIESLDAEIVVDQIRIY